MDLGCPTLELFHPSCYGNADTVKIPLGCQTIGISSYMLLYSFYAFLLIVRSSIILKLKIDCKMSPDNVASSITLGNFTVGRRYRPIKV